MCFVLEEIYIPKATTLYWRWWFFQVFLHIFTSLYYIGCQFAWDKNNSHNIVP